MTTPVCPDFDELGLFTDLYELSMAQAYWAERMAEPAVFSLFFRKLPEPRNFILACGQVHAARLVTGIRFPRRQLDRLAGLGLFQDRFLDWLEGFRFSGDIHALEEGTPVFPHEPLLEVRAPVAEAQLLESMLMNYINLETLLASKAARMVLAAGERPVIDFGMRRMHGLDAALRGVRAYRVAGVAGTSNVLGALRYGLPPRGTMAHSFIQAHDDEMQAFRLYARLYPGTTLLVDTYDTLVAVDKVISLVRDEGLDVGGIRLDSGDLGGLATKARQRLDRAGLQAVKIVASGGLDEWRIRDLLAGGAPIDSFGVGTEMGSVADAPALDFAYKLTEYAGEPRLKNSPGKQLVPGAKQVWRFQDAAGRYTHDEITRREEIRDAAALLKPVIRDGEPCTGEPDLEMIRRRSQDALQRMPADMLRLEPMHTPYPVRFSSALRALRGKALATLDQHLSEK
ncbi:MAG: nicotinate phosphoribosyltransferase [Aquisalimonadaceae bacterium]